MRSADNDFKLMRIIEQFLIPTFDLGSSILREAFQVRNLQFRQERTHRERQLYDANMIRFYRTAYEQTKAAYPG